VTHLTGRIDAIVYAGNGVVLAATRRHDPGHIFRSADYGVTWTHTARPTESQMLNLLHVGGHKILASTYDGEIWKSDDLGVTWALAAKISDTRVYSMVVAADGSVLASEFKRDGGHVFKSTDQGNTWTDRGEISNKAVYRFQRVGDGVLVNGEAGHVYKTTDNGDTWIDQGPVSDEPLYATEYLGRGIALQGDKEGRLFKSADDGKTWSRVTDVGPACDDFVHLGNGVVVLSVYLGNKHLFRSVDYGDTWTDIGPTPKGDILDHAIFIHDGPTPKAIGGTTGGWIISSP
jgi:photosystem II stability/assembly factor-like uncharacterized protein